MQGTQRRERAAAGAQLTADAVDPPRRCGEPALQLGQQRCRALAARVEQVVACRQERLPTAGEVVELRLHRCNPVARLTECSGELLLATGDSCQPGLHKPPGAV